MRGFRTLTFWYLLLVDPNPPNPCWGCLNFVTWKCEQIKQKCNNCCYCYCCCCQLMFISNNKINYLTGHFIHEHVCTLSTRSVPGAHITSIGFSQYIMIAVKLKIRQIVHVEDGWRVSAWTSEWVNSHTLSDHSLSSSHKFALSLFFCGLVERSAG